MSSAKNSSGRCLRRNALSTNQPDRNENELEIPTNVLPLLHPSPRAPLTTIQDPQLSPQGLPNASDFEPKFNLVHHVDIKAEASGSGGHMLNFQVRGFSTPGEVRGKSELTSAHTTPARSVSKVFRGSGFPKVSRATANPLSWLPAQVPHFELDEDSSFWMDHNVQVLIRIRPISNTEKVSEDDSRCLRQDSAQDLTWLGHPVTRFTFDHVACETLSQEKLFKVVGLPMVENCMSGYNSCMFAYGQTGSGKTYTMMGAISLMDKHPTEDCGMTPRIFQYLFTRIREEEDARKDEKLKYNCKCSFLEIYNEQITDLLEPSSNNLQLREDQKKGVYVENLTECEVTNAEDVIELLMQGAANRKMAATHMNSESSRSHSVFTCVIESRWEKDSMIHIRFGRLNLVDLAGSERQKSSGAEGERLKEAANINKSLSTLGLVIMTLVDVAHGKHRHVPYRDSRLTFLLQDSLGGNSKTTIIANVSPSICSANETLSTLKFAQRAKLIQNNAKVNEDASGDVIALQQQIQKLKDQVSYLLQNQKVKMLQPSSVKFNLPDLREENSLFPGETVLTSYNYLVSPCKRTNYLEATLVGALRREKIAETSVTNLEAEIEHLNQLLQQREEDGQRTKLMLRICEDKIKRMGMLTDGLLCAEEYLLEENNALKEDINLLQRKIDRNPELTQIALENIRLLEKLRQFQNYYEHGEREILMAEVSALRDQLLDVYEGHCSLVNFHGSQATQDEVEVPMQEEADDLLKVLKDCRNEKFTRKANNFFSQLKKCVAPKQDILQVQDAYCEFSQGITDSNGGLQTADTIVDAQGKLSTFELEVDFVNESESSAEGCSWLLKTGKVQREHRLDELHHENSILRKAISAKDTEIIAVNKEWEQAILNLTSYLVDGFQLLQESSDQMGNILAFFSQRSSIGQQVEAAIEVFIKNENTISCLVKSLEDAQKAAMEMECKLSSLKRAAVSITAFYELKDCESTKEVLQLRTLLTEEISAIQDLENELRNMDRVVIEATKSSDVASIGIHNINRANVPESSSSQEYEEMLLSNPGSNSEEMMKQANKLLMKFEEAQETMKEADITLNELLRVNETTKHEVDSWKEAFEELMLERNILMEEVKQLKDLSVLQHLNNLEEIEEFVHTFERSFLQRNDVKEALKLISCDCNPIWEEVKRSIDNTRLSFEDIWFTNMEKQLVSLILYHSILEVNEDSNTYTNRQARVIPSYWRADLPLNLNYLLKGAAEFEEDTPDTASNSVFPVRNEDIKIGCIMQPSLCFEESLPLHWSSSKVFKKLGLISDTNEDHISSVCQIAGTDAFPESMLLKELNQKNFLLQGLLFDIRLLQESMSNARDIKDETYSIQTSLCKVQHELETKTAQLDHISVKFRKLEASLADIETVLSTSNSELDLANEKISLLADENFKWKLLLDEIYVDKGNLEKQLEEKQGVVMVLENEISQMSDIVDGRILSSIEDIEKRLAQMREERDKLQAEVYFLNDKLEASDALANEYEAIATEARQLSETSKVYAEQKEEEVKILERSVEELECTVTLLERKVYEMGEEVKAHHALREDLKLELEALRQRIQPVNENNKSLDAEIFNGGESTENKISRNADKMVREIFEMKRHIMILEAENKNQAKEIKQYKNYITEVVLHADAQASQYQGKYMTLETMIRKVKTGPSTSTSTTSMPNKMESSARARGSGSPFRCIVGLVQQVNSEKDRELSVARSRIEELEAIALNWQREVCMLKARLAATENMTYDVIRDLLGLKLDVTNYVNVVDQCQLQIFAEAQRPLNKPNSELD